jgi:hypothetical protein
MRAKSYDADHYFAPLADIEWSGLEPTPNAPGQLWISGSPTGKSFTREEKRRRVCLPTYPFERKRH